MPELRAALRLFRSHPTFCAAVILTLAIGLGAVTAILSVAYALLLRPLPFPNADRIVSIHAEVAGERGRLALQEIRDLERDARTLAKVGTYYRTQYNVTGGGPPEALTCTMPSSAMFEVLGVRMLHGDVWPAALDFTRQYTVVLSHGLWQQRFGARPDAVGQSIVMDGAVYRIAGVLPDGLDFPLQTDVFRALTDYNAPHVRRYSAIARIADGRTLGDVQSELDGLSARFASVWPDTNRGVRLKAVRLRDAYVGGARPFIWLMIAGVALLLVTACVNVTNLLLSRALSQQGDSAVRLALGASRRHLVRQSTIEALVLALCGAGLGAVGAQYAIAVLTRMVGDDLPPWLGVEMNTTVLLASAAIAVAVAIAVGLLPGRLAARTDVERVLRQESGRSAGGARQRTARRWLVGAQAAVASVLLVAAGVFAAGLSDLLRLDPGFETRGVFTFRVDPPFSRYGDIRTTSEFYRRAIEDIRTIPGVAAAGTNTNLPFARLDIASPRVVVEGRETGRPEEEPFVNLQIVDGGYFDAMGIPLVSGRWFEPTDAEAAPLAAIVSDRVARRFWSGDAIGRRLRVNWNQNGVGSGGGSDLWLTIVGVVRSVRFDGMDDDEGLDVYAANTQMFAGDSFFAIRTEADPAQLQRAVRAAIDQVDPDQSFFDAVTMEARVAKTLWQHRVSTAVLLMFAAVGLVLAVIGTYAVTAHAVAAQRREIGIRLALGSSGSAIGWLVARDWMVPIVIGVGGGFAAGAVAAQQLAVVIGIAVPLLGWPFALPAVLALAAAAACSLPVARLLRRVALTETLRAE